MPKWFGESVLAPDRLIPPDQQWRLQWDRVIRRHERVLATKATGHQARFTQYDVDVVIVFFQNCQHLKDWILACRPDLKSKLETLSNTNFEIKACENICNGFKHKDRTPGRAELDARFNLYVEYDHLAAEVDSASNPERLKIAFEVDRGVREFDAFELAERCFGIWKEFISLEFQQTDDGRTDGNEVSLGASSRVSQ